MYTSYATIFSMYTSYATIFSTYVWYIPTLVFAAIKYVPTLALIFTLALLYLAHAYLV